MRWMAVVFSVMMTTLCGTGLVFAQPIETLDEPEQLAMSDTLQYALENNPSNEVSNWVNPDTGRSGAVVPVKTFTNEAGLPCREFVTTIVIGGKEEQGYGTACRQPDGSWQIVTDEEDTVAPEAPANVYVYTPPERYVYVYPDMYYNYPSSFYYPYNIYLSFSYVFRRGSLYYGAYYLDGPSFRYRYPVYVRSRVYMGPRIFSHHRWFYRPAVHYRHVVRPPVHHDRYGYRNRDVTRPVYRERQEYRQRQILQRENTIRQEQHRQPAVSTERQRQILREQERNRQDPRRQPAVNMERQRQSLQQHDRNRQDSRRQPAVNVESQRQRSGEKQQVQPQQRQQRQPGMNMERRMPETQQRSPYAGQERERQQVHGEGNWSRQDGTRQEQGLYDGGQRSR